jgi:hypothetical protein
VAAPNTLRWNGRGGHYEVYYLTLTEPASGVGVWVRYTLEAPIAGDPSCALWFAAMDPATGVVAHKQTLPIDQLTTDADPFKLKIGSAELDEGAASGGFEDVSWDLQWEPGRTYEPVPPLLRRFASTVLVLPHGDVPIDGTVAFGGRELELSGARGGQTHLWGVKHAGSWAWARCSDFRDGAGEPVRDTFVDGVAARVRRFGRELRPVTLMVGRINGEDFRCVSLRGPGGLSAEGWAFAATAGRRHLIGMVKPDRRLLAGVTYHDPDGDPAYCYNSESAHMWLEVQERGRPTISLIGEGTAHFEYGQRQPVPELELHLR